MEVSDVNIDVINFKRACRSCLHEYEEMEQLFVTDHHQEGDLHLGAMLALSTQIMIDMNDGLPCQICKGCSSKLYAAYIFRQQCRNADSILKKYLKHLSANGDVLQTEVKVPAVKKEMAPRLSTCNSSEIIDFNTVFNSSIHIIKEETPVEAHDRTRNLCEDVILHKNDKCTQTEFEITKDENSQTLAELKLQLKAQNSNQIVCSECGKTYTRLGCHRKHMLEAHGLNLEHEIVNDETVCQICKMTFTAYTYLKRHMRLAHDKRKVYVCILCDEGYNKFNNFQKHANLCKGVKYTCDHCQQAFKKQHLLNLHIQNMHPEILELIPTVKELLATTDDIIKNEDSYSATSPITNECMDSEILSLSQTVEESLVANSDVKEEPLDDLLDEAERETSDMVDNCEDNLTMEFLDDDNVNNNDDIENEILSKCTEPLGSRKLKRKVGRPRKYPLVQNDLHRLVDEMKYHCDECPKGFHSTLGLKIHKAKHFGERIGFECTYCRKIFSKLTALKRHKMIHGGHEDLKRYHCEVCGKGFNRQDFLERHMALHFDIKPYQCEECPRSFLSSVKLETHKAALHSDKVKNPKVAFCAICNQGFTTKQYLSTHIRMHNGDKTFTCDICQKSFNSKWHLREHTKWHSSEKQFLCSECGQRFIRNDYLVIHMRRHKGEKPYKCKFCNKGFPRATDLTVHERYHTGEKTHLCMVCGKGFQRQYNLTVHLRVHTGERPYPCRYCNKRFAQSNDLKSHVRRHTGERSSCDVCGEGFIQGYHLTQHKRSVHGIDCKSHIRRVEKHSMADPNEPRKVKSKKRIHNSHLSLQSSMENQLTLDHDVNMDQNVIHQHDQNLSGKSMKMGNNLNDVPEENESINIAAMKALVPQNVFTNVPPPRLVAIVRDDSISGF